MLLHNVFSLDEAHNLALKAKEMVIRFPPFMRSYQSNKTTTVVVLQPARVNETPIALKKKNQIRMRMYKILLISRCKCMSLQASMVF